MVLGVLCPCGKVRPCVKFLHVLGGIETRKFALFCHSSLMTMCCYYSCTIRSILNGVAGSQRPGSVFKGFCCLVVGVWFGFVLGFFKFLFFHQPRKGLLVRQHIAENQSGCPWWFPVWRHHHYRWGRFWSGSLMLLCSMKREILWYPGRLHFWWKGKQSLKQLPMRWTREILEVPD